MKKLQKQSASKSAKKSKKNKEFVAFVNERDSMGRLILKDDQPTLSNSKSIKRRTKLKYYEGYKSTISAKSGSANSHESSKTEFHAGGIDYRLNKIFSKKSIHEGSNYPICL